MKSLESIWQTNLENGILQLPRCQQCHGWNWYPLPKCKHCQSVDVEWEEVSLSGRVYSWTQVHRNFSGQKMPHEPYIVGLIEINDAPGVRIPCFYIDGQNSTPSINADVTLIPCREDDRVFWGFKL